MFRYTGIQRDALRLLGGDARHVMLFGGSRSGKTFVICCAVTLRALRWPGSRHAAIRRHFNAVRTSIGLDTLPKVLRTRFAGVPYLYNRADSVFRFPNGSEIWLLGLDDGIRAEKILGKEFATLYFNECSEIEYPAVQLALTRLAQRLPGMKNRVFYDCNPPAASHWTHRVFIEKTEPQNHTPLALPEDYASLLMNPGSNRENLPEGYIEQTLAALPRRERERFLEGKWQADVTGALWRQDTIDASRLLSPRSAFSRVIIGVDPAVTGNPRSDETGIVAAALGEDGDFYVLEDASLRGTPEEWIIRAVSCYRHHQADAVAAEVNNGGDLVAALLAQCDKSVNLIPVRATRGKIRRAEPVAALYERGKVHHLGVFKTMEEQMTSYSGSVTGSSPDRMDALVWALTVLAGSDDEPRFVLG